MRRRCSTAHVAVGAAAAGLGLADEDAAVTRILSLDPDYAYNVAADLENRHVAPELGRAIVASLKKAGLAPEERPFEPVKEQARCPRLTRRRRSTL